MPTNDFLPVGTEGTPNVMPQGDYAGSTAQRQGFAVGQVPPSPQWNKMMRQATFVAAGLAQFMVNQSGEDVLDDGDLDAFVALLTSAINGTLALTQLYTAAGAETLDPDVRNAIINQTVAAAKTIRLPAAPPDNYQVSVIDGKGDAGTNVITVDGNGHTIKGGGFSGSTWPIQQNGQALTFVWSAEDTTFYIKG